MLESDIQASRRVKPRQNKGVLAIKKAKKKAKGLDSDEEDSEDDFAPLAKKKPSPKKASPVRAKAKAAPKPKAVVPLKRDR
jgi:hypothetical protein